MRSFPILGWAGFWILSVMARLPAASGGLIRPSDPGEPRPAAPHEGENIIQTLEQQALPELMQSLTEKKKTSRLRVTRIDGDLQDHRATQYLVQAYEDTSSVGVRCKILESIGKFHDRAQLAWLSARLNDPHIGIQCFAIWALGELKTQQAAYRVRPKLWSANRFVQMTAIDALGKTGKDNATAAELSTFLHDEDPQVRYLAAKSLIGVAGPELTPELTERLLQEPSIDVQEALARTIGQIADADSIGHMIELLKNPPSQATERWAEVSLKAADPSVVIPALAPLLDGNDFRLKVAASHILGELEMTTLQEGHTGWRARVMRWAQGSDLVAREAAQRLLNRINTVP